MKNNSNVLKQDLYKAITFTTLLVLAAFPLSLLGLQLINFVFTKIPL